MIQETGKQTGMASCEEGAKEKRCWSRGWELNPRPADYESAALPLSYLGVSFDCNIRAKKLSNRAVHIVHSWIRSGSATKPK
jgi:hypothetical protein